MCAKKVCPFLHPILWARQRIGVWRFSRILANGRMKGLDQFVSSGKVFDPRDEP